jgi:kynurenine formamidase
MTMLEATVSTRAGRYRLDLDAGIPLSIQLRFDGPQPNAFGMPEATASPVRADGFVGDTRQGGSCNCSGVTLYPHGNGTHTECVGHIVDERVPVAERLHSALIPATVATVTPERLGDSGDEYFGDGDGDDWVVSRRSLHRALGRADSPECFRRALVLRTGHVDDPGSHRWSGSNPPYLTSDAVDLMLVHDVRHLLVDLPSIDREDDGGTLPNHHAFFGVPSELTQLPAEPSPRTVTEMATVPSEVEEGACFVDIQVPDFALDAAPSRPLLFRAERAEED